MFKIGRNALLYLALVTVLGLTLRHFFSADTEPATALSAQPLFSSQLPDAQGEIQDLGRYRGKIVVLNFWATWCAPCREEMPELSQIATQYQAHNVLVLGVAIDEAAAVRTFLDHHPIRYPTVVAENEGMALGELLGNHRSVLPYTVIINAEGVVVQTYFGRIHQATVLSALQKLLSMTS